VRMSLGVCLIMLGTGCAHTAGKTLEEAASTQGPSPEQAARARELSSQARKSYDALDFPACAEQYRQAAEASTDDFSRADSLYSAAGCASLAGEPPQALMLLKRSVQSGYYDADTLRHDPELSPLHSLAGWEEVVAAAQANLAKAPHPPMPVGRLVGIDVYGSRRVDAEIVRRVLGLELGEPTVPSKALLRMKERELKEQYNLAFAKVAFVYFFAGDDAGSAFITVDMVDAEDAQRLRFLPLPSGSLPDPEGLIAQWLEYDRKSEHLMRSGGLNPEEPFTCRVAHCIFGFGHPELAPFEPIFVAKVPGAQDALVKVLREDADEEKRAAAAYLLAYAPSPEQVVARLVPFTRDPSGAVRNAVLRVILANQDKAERPLVEVAVVVDAVSMPETLDRNKALYLLEALLRSMKPEALKAQRAPLIRQLGSQLVAMAGLTQPINREPAVMVLEQLSGKKFETAEQWKAWLARQGK
jgi:hypothetical protein